MVDFFATDFQADSLRLGQQVVAHVRVLPTIAAYDPANGGYENGAVEGRDLLVDLPITVDSHCHVPIKYSHLNMIKDMKKSYEGALEDQAFVLGRGMVNSVLNKVNSVNITAQTIDTPVNTDLETLESINSAMNINGAARSGRFGIVSTAVAQALALDNRIASRDFYGSLTGGISYRVFRNIAGFEAIYEYPDFQVDAPGFFAANVATDVITKAFHGLANGTRVRLTSSGTLPAGLALATTYFVSGATLNSFQLTATLGGAAVDITGTGTGNHSVVSFEQCTGFFGDGSAVALRAGIPEQSHEAAREMGIPLTMGMDKFTDSDSGFTLAMMKWMKGGTGDLYISPASLWGSAVGKQGGASGSIVDRGGHRLVSA